MTRRIHAALLLGAGCFVGITIAFFGIYVGRLCLSGFPPLDVQHDRQVFASHVFPIAAIGASIFGSSAELVGKTLLTDGRSRTLDFTHCSENEP
jgi:hypothetical protein